MTTSSRDHEPATCAGLDLSKIRPGDEVTVRAYVKANSGNSICIRVLSLEIGDWVRASAIATHTPRPLAVGERVIERNLHGIGTVLFSDKLDTVVRWDEGGIHSGSTETWGVTLRCIS